MIIQQALTKYRAVEIELLLSHILGKPKEFLFMEPDHKLSVRELVRLKRMIQRRKRGEPVAYILGYKDFMGLRFKVNRHVLIPRPETEELVYKVLEVCKVSKEKHNVRILDVGTGSGCIAISIAEQLKKLRITNYELRIVASDISRKTLNLARQNAKSHKAKIKFIQSDLFEKIHGKFDVVVANLPYVPKKYYKLKIKNLGWEPKVSLIDPRKDFYIFKRFFKQVQRHLNPKAVILFEIDPSSQKYLTECQKRYLPKAKVRFYKDFSNLIRYMEIKTK